MKQLADILALKGSADIAAMSQYSNGLMRYLSQAVATLDGETINTYAVTNILANWGNFAADANSDGYADGWRTQYAGTPASLADNIQTFTPDSKYDNLALSHLDSRPALRATFINDDICYVCGYVRTTDANAEMTISGTNASTLKHSGSGEWEFLSRLCTVTDVTGMDLYFETFASANFVPIQVQLVHVLKINASDMAALTKTQIDKIMQAHIAENGFITTGNISDPSITLGTLSHTRQIEDENFTIEVEATVPSGNGGIALCVDSFISPNHCILAYIYDDGGYKLCVKKYVDRIPTTLIDESITYVAENKLKVIKNGNTYSVYYDDVQIGTNQTINDVSIVYNDLHCLFATDTSISFFGFSILESALSETPLMKFVWGSDMHIDAVTGLSTDQLTNLFKTMNTISDAEFLMLTGDILDDGYSSNPELMAAQLAIYEDTSKYYNKPIYAFRGNHDVDVSEFLEHGVIESNGVKIIYFHADYVTITGAPDYDNTGDVTETELTWLETQLSTGTSMKILACHWSIVEDDINFKWPITDEHGRTEILALAEQYGAKLYLSGHEHASGLPVGTAGVLENVSGTSAGNGFYVCTIYEDKIVIDMHRPTYPFKYVKTIEISLI